MTEAVERKAERKGGIYALGRKDYWIPEPLYSEVVAKDDATPLGHRGTQEFGKWLKDFIKKHDIKPDKKNTKSMAGYWAMPYSYSPVYTGYERPDFVDLGLSAEKTIKMASVLRAMKSVVSVVDPEHKLAVEYNKGLGTSYWDTDKKVSLPVEPIDAVDDLEDCINVMAGFSNHEAWHSQFTRDVLDAKGLDFVRKSQWNMWLLNILEDPRIEHEGLKETPGHAEYLNYVNEYLWEEKGLPTEWPDDPRKKIGIASNLIRYKDRIDEVLTDESWVAPREWLRDWSQRYIEAQSTKATSDTMIAFVNEGKKYLEITEEDEVAGDPDTKGVMSPCATIHGDKGISDGVADKVDKAIEEETEAAGKDTKAWESIFGFLSKKMGYGANMDSVVVRRPRSRGKYRASRGDLVEKAKAALVLRKTEPQHDTRLQSQGILDEDELYRVMARDTRVFKDATIESLPRAAVYMLVDMSGSMGSAGYEGYSAYYAVKTAQLLVEGLSRNPNVKLKVLGHSGQNIDNRNGGSFYRIWEPGDSLDRLSILSDRELYAQNFDGWAIAWAGNMLYQEDADQKLLIVLADGVPAAHGYGGDPALRHVREVSDKLLRKGVNVVQVAVSSGLNEAHQKAMFKHYIAVSTGSGGSEMFSVILRKLTKLLKRIV